MHGDIDRLVGTYEAGHISRRRLVTQLSAMTALATTVGSASGAQPWSTRQDPGATFQAVGLNHIALSVTDISRSRDFYVRHLGLTVSRESASSCFLDCGPHFVALFRSRSPGLNHYCYEVDGYDVNAAAETLRANDLPPRVSGSRIYFDDPDGLEVQLAAPGHGA